MFIFIEVYKFVFYFFFKENSDIVSKDGIYKILIICYFFN